MDANKSANSGSASDVTGCSDGRENLTLGQLATLASGLGAGPDVAFLVLAREEVRVPDAGLGSPRAVSTT